MSNTSNIQRLRARGTDSARVIQVIETKALCGSGTVDDPVFIISQYWSMEGELLAENGGGKS
jgi:hypothetical protein